MATRSWSADAHREIPAHAAEEAFALIDGRGRIASASDGFSACLGHPLPAEQLVGRPVEDILGDVLTRPDAVEAAHWLKALGPHGHEGGLHRIGPLRLHGRAGSALHMVAQGASGARLFLHVRRRAPTMADAAPPALSDDEGLARLLDALPDPVFITDAAGVLRQANAAAREFLGHPAADFAGQDAAALLPPDLAEAMSRADAAVWETGQPTRFTHAHNVALGHWREYEIHKALARHTDGHGLALVTLARDITVQDTMIRQGREQARLLDALLTHFPYFVFWKDRNLVYQGCSQNFADSFAGGSRGGIIGGTDHDVMPLAAEAEVLRGGDRAVITTGTPLLDIRRIVHRPDGTAMHLMLSTVALRDRAGAVSGVLSVARDVTAAHRMEAERDRLSRIMQALLQLPVVIFQTDDAGTITERLGPASEGDADGVGRDIVRLLPGAAGPLREALTQRRTVRFETAADHGGWALDMVFGPDRPGRRGFLAVGLDVTDRRRAEARFRAMFEKATIGLALLDGQGRIVTANEALCRILGEEPAALLGRQAGDLVPVPAPGRWQSWREVVGGHQAGAPPPPWLRIGRHAVADGTAEGAASILMVEDSAEVRELESQLAHLSKLSALGEMAASLAHEINQPLNTIRLVAEAALEDLPAAADAKRVRKALDTIHGQTLRVAEIIHHVRQFSHRDGAAPRPFDPVAVTRTVARLYRHQTRKAGVTLEIAAPRSGPLILGHTVRFEQMLINLLSNALDAATARHGTKGGGRISVSLRQEEESRTVVLAVADNGAGIPDTVRQRIFQPFFTTKSADKGSGLGLAICLTIAAEMNGRIDIGSPSHGALIEVHLPVPETPRPPPSSGPDQGTGTGAVPLDVLVADDDPIALDTVAAALRERGARVVTARTGREAFALWQRHRPGVVLTDLTMPDGSGEDLVMRLAEAAPALPILVMTGRGVGAEPWRAHVVEVLPKPLSLPRLQAILDTLTRA